MLRIVAPAPKSSNTLRMTSAAPRSTLNSSPSYLWSRSAVVAAYSRLLGLAGHDPLDDGGGFQLGHCPQHGPRKLAVERGRIELLLDQHQITAKAFNSSTSLSKLETLRVSPSSFMVTMRRILASWLGYSTSMGLISCGKAGCQGKANSHGWLVLPFNPRLNKCP